MASQDDVRRIALALPGVTEGRDRFGFSVDHRGKARGFVWVWMERIHPIVDVTHKAGAAAPAAQPAG